MISGLFSLPLARLPEASGTASRAGNGAAASVFGEQFLAGPENILVRSLAAAMTSEALPFNPLVLCGPSGVGKSALAHALAAKRASHLQAKVVIATTGSDFARSLANAIESDSVADLRKRHQRCDVLLIDELHRLAPKHAAQQFLLSILDLLLQRGSLVIATLRRPPQASEGLLPNLASRLAGGLVVPLAPPGLLARREFVRQTAAQHDLGLSDELLAKLAGDESATSIPFTAPRLRHAVLQLAAANLPDRPIRATQVAQVLAADSPDTKAIIKQVTAIVAKEAQLTQGELKGKSRQQAIADARGLAMFLIRRLTQASYAEIGRHFGDRDHSTVLHACQKFEKKEKTDDQTRRLVAELTARVAAGEAG